jgi:hypothetical protein
MGRHQKDALLPVLPLMATSVSPPEQKHTTGGTLIRFAEHGDAGMAGREGEGVDPKSLPVSRRVELLVKALDGAVRTNEALARCSDGEAMLDVLLDASARLGLGLSRRELENTPPIRDWIWWKNKQALLTIGDNKPRYQQDGGQGLVAGNPAARKRFLGLF